MDRAHQQTMDRIYRHMKYVYDATRPLFLAGRRALRRAVQPAPGQRVLEIGCGTGRNLVVLARRCPHASFTGVDISTEMLSYARAQVSRCGLDSTVTLLEGELDDVRDDPAFRAPFDYVLFSYSLSMIPDWEGVLRRALALLAPQTGRLLIADFGGCEAWPGPLARRLCKNLSYFHVTPRPQLAQFLRSDRSCGTLQVTQTRLLGGYGQVLEVGRRSSSRGAIGHA